jgi:hypothetical protein
MNAIIDNIETKIETDFEKACKFLNAIRHKLDDEAVALFHEIFNTPKVNLSAGESSLGKSTATSNVSGTGASANQDSLSSSISSTPTVSGATSSPEPLSGNYSVPMYGNIPLITTTIASELSSDPKPVDTIDGIGGGE